MFKTCNKIIKSLHKAVKINFFGVNNHWGIIHLKEVVASGKKCSKSVLKITIHFGRNTAIQPNQYSIPDDNFKSIPLWTVLRAQIWHIYFSTPPPYKENISALELSIVTNRVAL